MTRPLSNPSTDSIPSMLAAKDHSQILGHLPSDSSRPAEKCGQATAQEAKVVIRNRHIRMIDGTGGQTGRTVRCTRCPSRLCPPPSVTLGAPERERWQKPKIGCPDNAAHDPADPHHGPRISIFSHSFLESHWAAAGLPRRPPPSSTAPVPAPWLIAVSNPRVMPLGRGILRGVLRAYEIELTLAPEATVPVPG